MKKICLLLFLIPSAIWLMAQEKPAGSEKKTSRFFIGVSYSYMSIDTKLSSLSLHSEWFGSDVGSTDLTEEEIDELNSYTDRSTKINAVTINGGMTFVDKPESNWKIRGTLFLGLAQNLTTIDNKQTGIQEYSFNSGFSKPALGVGFDVTYRLNKHWGLSLRPYVIGSKGKTTDVKDLINPEPINFNAEKEDKYLTTYLRASLYASFSAGPVTIYAGPGFYYFWSKHEYRRQYTNIETGQTIIENNTYINVPAEFFDGSIAIAWNIIKPLTLTVDAGVGRDLMIDGGIRYNF